MIPIRFLFRSRWAALAWAAGICWTAIGVAHDHRHAGVDAANSAQGNAAQDSALLAEDS